MLEGVVLKPLKRTSDERGFFTELIRLDWKNILNGDSLSKQISPLVIQASLELGTDT